MGRWRDLLSFWLACVTLALSFAPAARAADWLRAETPHFVVHSAQGEKGLREYALMLEDFDAALRVFHSRPIDEPVRRKLPIYLVKDVAEFRRVFPDAPPGIIGNYVNTEDEIFVVAIRADRQRQKLDSTKGDDIVLHEYVHHFMLQYYPNAYPGWLVEGYAEYFMTADLAPDKITIGRYNSNRINTLVHAPWLPAATLLSKSPHQFGGLQASSFYAESWLLTHYIIDDKARRDGLVRYVGAIQTNKNRAAAWTEVFGQTPEDLDAVLKTYLLNGVQGAVVTRTWAPAAVAMTKMSPGAGATVLDNLLFSRQTPPIFAAAALKNVRKAADRFPKDRAAQLAYARGETRYGDRAKGEAVLKALIAADPDDSEALRNLAVSQIASVERQPDRRKEVYREAGRLLAAAEKIDPDNYQTLYRYAQTRSVEPGYPTENTLNVLLKAVSLGPQLPGMRIEAARAAMLRKDPETARRLLAPVVGDPHGGTAAIRGQALLDQIDRAEGLTPPPPLMVAPVRKTERIEQLAPAGPPPPALQGLTPQKDNESAPPKPPEAAASPARPGS
jgi:hypothetical protein